MKTITLAEAYTILDQCSAVEFDLGEGPTPSYPQLADLAEGDNDNEFLYLSPDGEDGTFAVKFREGDNHDVKVNGGIMYLTDDEGTEIEITILQPAQLG